MFNLKYNVSPGDDPSTSPDHSFLLPPVGLWELALLSPLMMTCWVRDCYYPSLGASSFQRLAGSFHNSRIINWDPTIIPVFPVPGSPMVYSLDRIQTFYEKFYGCATIIILKNVQISYLQVNLQFSYGDSPLGRRRLWQPGRGKAPLFPPLHP